MNWGVVKAKKERERERKREIERGWESE